MKLKKLTLFLPIIYLLLFSLCNASAWSFLTYANDLRFHYITNDEDGSIFFDDKTLKIKDNRIIVFWVREVYSSDEGAYVSKILKNTNLSKTEIESIKYCDHLEEIDVKTTQIRFTYVRFYSDDKLVYEEDITEKNDWHKISPGTLGDTIYQEITTYVKDHVSEITSRL